MEVTMRSKEDIYPTFRVSGLWDMRGKTATI